MWLSRWKAERQLASEWEKWSQIYLENLFWKMVDGKEPIRNRDLECFITEMKYFLKSQKEYKVVANPSNSWINNFSYDICKELNKAISTRHYTDASLKQYEDALKFVELYVGTFVWWDGCASSIAIWWSYDFCWRLNAWRHSGLKAVLKELPEKPIRSWKEIPESRQGPRLREALKYLDTAFAVEIAEAKSAIDQLRPFANNDKTVAELVALLEQCLEQVQDQSRQITRAQMESTSGQMKVQIEQALQELRKEEAIKTANDKVIELMALSKAALTVESVTENDQTENIVESALRA